MNKVSVLLTTYDNDNITDLKESINSLYNQSFQDFDIFIQEDGVVSPDIHTFLIGELNSGKIKHLGKRNTNKGLDYSLNELINKVLCLGYEYIVRMDSDDISMPERIERQLEFMNNKQDIDVCGTYIKEFGDDIKYSKLVVYPLTHDSMLRFFQKRVPIAHVTAFFRRSYFEKAGLYQTKGHISNEDSLLWMSGFLSGCKFANITYVGVMVRVSKNFFRRRGGWKKILSDFENRLTINKKLHFGFLAYLYAIAVSVVNMLPSILKRFAYKYLR
jgi:glycosyltransferase involved in cell wall biosynthesis